MASSILPKGSGKQTGKDAVKGLFKLWGVLLGFCVLAMALLAGLVALVFYPWKTTVAEVDLSNGTVLEVAYSSDIDIGDDYSYRIGGGDWVGFDHSLNASEEEVKVVRSKDGRYQAVVIEKDRSHDKLPKLERTVLVADSHSGEVYKLVEGEGSSARDRLAVEVLGL